MWIWGGMEGVLQAEGCQVQSNVGIVGGVWLELSE